MSEQRKFYIADWHYGHANVLHFDNRPFKNVEEMNAALVKNWNSVVRPGDLVYILGDMFWCKEVESLSILDVLNGEKVLIRGNHDRCNDGRFVKKFSKITEYMEVQDGKFRIILCHYPIVCFKNHHYGFYHFYGHVHNSFEYNMMEHNKLLMQDLYQRECCRMFNVGVMMPYMDYTPRTFEEIVNNTSPVQ